MNPDLAVKLQTTINWKSALLKKKTEKVDQINFGGGTEIFQACVNIIY